MVAPVAGSEAEEHMVARPRQLLGDTPEALVKPVEEVTGRDHMARWVVVGDSVGVAEHTEEDGPAHVATVGHAVGAAEDAAAHAEEDAADGVATVVGDAEDAGCKEAEHEDVVVAVAEAAVEGGVAGRSAMVHMAGGCRAVS